MSSLPSLYFVDAQGDVTWTGGVNPGNHQGKPALVISKEADLRFRNYRFPDVAWLPAGTLPPPKQVENPVIRTAVSKGSASDWSVALEEITREDAK
jgi:hypothetical protein